MSPTEYFSPSQYFTHGTDDVGMPLDHREDDSEKEEEEKAPVAEYSNGHTDEDGYPLERWPTPWPRGSAEENESERRTGKRSGVKRWLRGLKKTFCLLG